jgi:hypothetical protein
LFDRPLNRWPYVRPPATKEATIVAKKKISIEYCTA